jgi:hypothetical protein
VTVEYRIAVVRVSRMLDKCRAWYCLRFSGNKEVFKQIILRVYKGFRRRRITFKITGFLDSVLRAVFKKQKKAALLKLDQFLFRSLSSLLMFNN